MSEIARTFWNNVQRRLDAIEKTERWLSGEIGRGHGFISSKISVPTKSPALEDAEAIAVALRTSLTELILPAAFHDDTAADSLVRSAADVLHAAALRARTINGTGSDAPSLSDAIAWHDAMGGRLEAHDQFLPYIEVFDPPDMDNAMPKPITIGRQSPASHHLGFSDVHGLVNVFQMHPEIADKVANAHHEVLTRNTYSLSRHKVVLHVDNFETHLSYDRLLLPVQDGPHRRIMLYARVTYSEMTTPEDLVQLDPARGEQPMLREYS